MRVGVAGGRMLGLLSCAIAALACAQVAAQSGPGVVWTAEECSQLSTAEVERLLAIELATQRAAAEGSEPAPSVALRCEGLVAHVRITQPEASAAPLEIELDLTGTRPEARARVLALAIAESIETAARPEAPRPRPAIPDDVPPPRAATPAARLGLFLAAGATRALVPGAIGPSFSLGVLQRMAAFSLQADFAVDLASVDRAQALVTARQLSASLAPGWHWTLAPFDVHVALGLRAGRAQLSATARASGERGRALTGWVIEPVARATCEWFVLPALAARLAVEAGYDVKPLRGFDADGQSLAAVSGMRVGAQLGVSVWLDGL